MAESMTASDQGPTLDYFSDVLCVWAFRSQSRLDRLKAEFPNLRVRYRFIPLFAAARERIQRQWGEQGGAPAFNRHLCQLAEGWDHVSLHPKLWIEVAPATSTIAHLYLKAVQLAEREGHVDPAPRAEFEGRSRAEEAVWRMRQAFFEQAGDVSDADVLEQLLRDLDLPLPELRKYLRRGEAHAALQLDEEAKLQHQVPGSPTCILDGGRQRLYGNVGYSVLEANVRELVRDIERGQATSC